MLTLERAKEINGTMVTDKSLIIHATNVMAAMGAMAEHFGEDKEYWQAVGYLHIRRKNCWQRASIRKMSAPSWRTATESARMWSRSQTWRRACSQWTN